MQGARFRYVGPGDGRGVMHTITGIFRDADELPEWQVMPDSDPGITITTWGDSFRAQGQGDTWLGPPHEFIKQFSPIKTTNQ